MSHSNILTNIAPTTVGLQPIGQDAHQQMAGQVKRCILSKDHAPACSEGTDIQFTQLRDFGSKRHLIRQSRTDLDGRHEFTFAVWQIVIRSSFADASFSSANDATEPALGRIDPRLASLRDRSCWLGCNWGSDAINACPVDTFRRQRQPQLLENDGDKETAD